MSDKNMRWLLNITDGPFKGNSYPFAELEHMIMWVVAETSAAKDMGLRSASNFEIKATLEAHVDIDEILSKGLKFFDVSIKTSGDAPEKQER